MKKEHQINYQIRDREIRLVAADGAQLGIMPVERALALAEEQNYDLVKISPTAVPPVCKIMDYGKFKFENAKREKEARKNQKIVELKEVWLSMTIDIHDINVKAKSAKKFLTDGDKVKVSIRMRGRQQAHPELGIDVMKRFYETLQDVCIMERHPLKEGRSIIMILAPNKN
ncbi:MAG: translation initiation factor IF-3 [Clostridia bacterium]|nr:translation initiation factor IF-3 [Clostridia bacterium]